MPFMRRQAGGFTPNGIIKPDVTAPGVEIFGPYPREQYGTMTGTSVAAAVTTGIAALFLQQFSVAELNGNIVPELLDPGSHSARRGVSEPGVGIWDGGCVCEYYF